MKQKQLSSVRGEEWKGGEKEWRRVGVFGFVRLGFSIRNGNQELRRVACSLFVVTEFLKRSHA